MVEVKILSRAKAPVQSKKNSRRFSDKLKKIKINVFRSAEKAIGKDPGLYTEGVQSHFQDAFEKYLSVNLTEDFHKFAVEVRGMVDSLPLLLYHKKDIWEILLKHLSKPDNLATNILLDLLTCLSRDLLEEFYPFFRDTLQIVVDLIDIKDSDRIEQCFTCIGYLFKYLRKLIVEDIDQLFFEYYFKIISHPKEFIRQFSAESFSFLLRNVKREKIDTLIDGMFQFQERIVSEGQKASVDILLFSDGLVNLFFETVKGIDYGFHSKMPNYLSALLRQFAKHASSWSFSVVFGVVKKMCAHTNPNHSTELFSILTKFMSFLLEKVPQSSEIDAMIMEGGKTGKRKRSTEVPLGSEEEEKLLTNIERTQEILHYCVHYRGGCYWNTQKYFQEQLFSIESQLISILPWRAFRLLGVTLSLISSSILGLQNSSNEGLIDAKLPDFLEQLFQPQNLTTSENIVTFSLFLRELMPLYRTFGRYVLRYVILLCNDYAHDHFDIVLHLFLQVMDCTEWNRAAAPSLVRISHQNRIQMASQGYGAFITYLINQKLSNFNVSLDGMTLDQIWGVLRVLEYTEVDYPSCLLCVGKLFEIFKRRSLEPSLRSAEEFIVLAEIFTCIYKLYRTYEPKELAHCWIEADKIIQIEPSNIHILQSVLQLIQIMEQTPASLLKASALQKIKTTEIFEPLRKLLMFNLSSCCQGLRIATYKLLIHLDPSHTDAESSFFAKFLVAEEVNKQSLEARAASHVLTDLEGSLRLLPSDEVKFITHCLIGCLHIKYSPLWPIAIKNLAILAERNFEDMFEILYVFLEQLHDIIVIRSNQVGQKRAKNHILGTKFHKPAGSGMTAQAPDTIKTALEENMDAIGDDPLQETFLEQVNEAEIRLGYSRGATDVFTLHSFVWKAFGLFSSRVEQVSKRIVPFFISYIQRQYAPMEWRSLTPSSLFDGFQFETVASRGEEKTDKYVFPKQLQPLLNDYLNVFGVFKNPRTLKYSDILKNIYEVLLAYGNSSTQKGVLKCLFGWKFDYLNPYRESLERIADDSTTREEMTAFNITMDSEVIKEEHREGLTRILIFILHAKLLAVNKRSKIHRHTILAYLGGLEINELRPLFQLLLRPYDKFFEQLKDTTLYDALDSRSLLNHKIQKVSLSKKSKLLVLLQEVFKQFGKRMEMYVPDVLNVIIGTLLYEFSQSNKSNANVRSACFKRLATIIQLYPNYDYSPYLQESFYEQVYPLIEKLAQQSKQGTPVLEFLVSMTSSPQMVLELHHTRCIWLLLDVINPSASTGVLGSILQMIESLVEVQEMIDTSGRKESVLPVYVDTIIAKLDALGLQASAQSTLVERILQVLAQLAKYATGTEQADHLLSALLVYLSPSYHFIPVSRRETIFNIILSLQRITKAPEEIIEPISYQFLSLTDPQARTILVSVIHSLSQNLPSFSLISEIISLINSYSTTLVGQYDYDSRLAGYLAIKEHFEKCLAGNTKSLPPTFYYPVIYNCLYFIQDDDMSIRANAEEVLKIGLQFCARELENVNENKEQLHQMKQQMLVIQWRKIATHMIFPFVKKQIRKSSKDLKFIGEALRLMHYLVESFPSIYGDLTSIVRPEWSFFLQFGSGSVSEQCKAIVHLKRFVGKQRATPVPFTNATYSNILVPLLFNRILNPKSAPVLMEEIIATLANICYHLSWRRYYQVLMLFINAAGDVSVGQQKQIIRLCCSVLDSFHFLSTQQDSNGMDVDDSDNESDEADDEIDDIDDEKTSPEHMEVDANETEEELESLAEAEEEENETKTKPKEKTTENKKMNEIRETFEGLGEYTANDLRIMESLTRQVIPKLLSFMKTNKAMISGNIAICQAVVKVVTVLPEKLQQREIPKLFKKMVINLRSRDQSVRDDTRETLVKVLQSLGCQYFGLALKELSSNLTLGYQLHVLGFTIHYLLFHLHKMKAIQANDLNNCVKKLGVVLLDDIIGEAAQKKEVKAIQTSMKETRSTKSYESYSIVAQSIAFSDHIQELIHPIYSILITSRSAKTVKKMTEILQKISIGLAKNTGIRFDQLLIFLHSVIRDNLQFFQTLEEKERQNESLQKSLGRLTEVQTSFERVQILQGPRSIKNARQQATEVHSNTHVLAEFALSLLFSCLKRNRFDTKDEQQIAMLNPFVDLLVKGLDSINEKSLILSLKCLHRLVKAPLPALEENLSKLNARVFELTQKTSSKSELMGILFKTQIILLRDLPPAPGREYSISLPEEQIKYLLTIANTNLDTLQRSSLTFSLLRAITEQKIILPEVYDIMKRVGELIVSSQMPAIRQSCLQIFLKFLLYYPLGEVRLQQHIDFILKNLSYFAPEGRQSVLELLHQIIEKFPEEHVNEQSEYFYFSLVLCLVNDDNAICREMAGKVIKLLLVKINEKKYQSVYALTQKWMNNRENLSLQRAAAQLFGLFIETTNENIFGKLGDVLHTLVEHLVDEDEEEDEDEDDMISLMPQRWHVVYYCLLAVEKLLRADKSVLKSKKRASVIPCCWKVVGLMLHSHSWIRMLCGRILGLGFSSLQSPKDLKDVRRYPFYQFLYTPGVSWLLARRLCLQLKSPYLTAADGQQIIRNLLFLSVALFNNESLHNQALQPLEVTEHANFGTINMFDDHNDEGNDNESEEEKEESKNNCKVVHWIFRTLSFTARRLFKHEQTSGNILKYYAGMATQLNPDSFEEFLIPAVAPIYHASISTVEDDVTELANEVAELIKQRVGVGKYLKAFHTIRKNAESAKLRRKTERKMEMVRNPKKAIEQKQKQSLKSREYRKRKISKNRGRIPYPAPLE